MKFYNRKKELEILETHWKNANQHLILDVLYGRRRIGKTALVREFAKNKPFWYFYVGRKPMPELLAEWSELLSREIPGVGTYSTLWKFLEALFHFTNRKKPVIMFDEFQNFKYIYPPAFSEFQHYIDDYTLVSGKQSKGVLVLAGSVITMMKEIFCRYSEPLFGRASGRFEVRPFDFILSSRILKDLNFIKFKDIFDLFTLFNGVPGYYKMIEERDLKGAGLEQIILKLFIEKNSLLNDEGKFLLQEAFGQEFERYFNVLSLIARGKARLTEIASAMKLEASKISVYLNRLEKNFEFIERRLPIFAKPESNLGRYYLKDITLNFWFRYIYPNLSWIEGGLGDILVKEVKKDFSNYQGLVLEPIVQHFLMQEYGRGRFPLRMTKLGRYWGYKDIEIDVVAEDEKKKQLFLGEIKLNKKRVNKTLIADLRKKAREVKEFKEYKEVKFGVITLERLNQAQQKLLNKERVWSTSLEDWVSNTR